MWTWRTEWFFSGKKNNRPEHFSWALHMPCLTFASVQPHFTATDEGKKEPEQGCWSHILTLSLYYFIFIMQCIGSYLIKAGGMSLFMIWSSVVCTVSFPTWKTQNHAIKKTSNYTTDWLFYASICGLRIREPVVSLRSFYHPSPCQWFVPDTDGKDECRL